MRRIIFRGAADIALRHKAHGAVGGRVGGRVGGHAAILTTREPEKVLSEKGEILTGRQREGSPTQSMDAEAKPPL